MSTVRLENNMYMQRITNNKKRFLDLLLLADEQESMIDLYLDRGELYALLDGDEAVAVAVVTDEGEGVCELKNLAVAPARQGTGLGKAMVAQLSQQYGASCHTMLVGTGDSPSTLPFYQRCGFVVHHRIPNFFTDNYDHPIVDGGVILCDMVVLARPLWIVESVRLGFRRLCHSDHAALCSIMGDPETMYAWEHGFDDEQVARWIDDNLQRYQQDGYSYCAAIDKATGELVGQIGLLREEINGNDCLGVGYIVARRHWGKGYAVEGAQAWLNYAFDVLGAPQVVADIRPSNTASLSVAQRLGMQPVGEYIKLYDGKEMPHIIYQIAKQ